MHILIVTSTPSPDSFTSALANALRKGAEAAAASVEVLDLHAEGFDPRITLDDRRHLMGDGPLPADITAHQARVERADALVFVYPIYWWGFPAMFKGWCDRVLTIGWAFDFDEQLNSAGRLHGKPVVQIRTGGSAPATYARWGYDQAMRTVQNVGIFGYCGLTDIETFNFLAIEGEHRLQYRLECLAEAQHIGASLAASPRIRRTCEVAGIHPA